MQTTASENIEEKIKNLDKDKIPAHIAVIMDGNGRWANSRGLLRFFGHKKGAERVKDITRVCSDLGVRVLTLYAFSSENWLRPKKEINALMKLLEIFLMREEKELKEKNIKLIVSGNVEKLPERTQKILKKVGQDTDNDSVKMILNLALSYGGREEIVDAAKKIAANILDGKNQLNEINEVFFKGHLYNPDIPDPDLLIRTSGEMRISNFLLWQIAYTEIYFTPVLWPDFSEVHLIEAIIDYQKRKRRFGRI